MHFDPNSDYPAHSAALAGEQICACKLLDLGNLYTMGEALLGMHP